MGKKLQAEKHLVDKILDEGRSIEDECIQEPGVLLKLVRRRIRMTQAQLAKLSGVSQSNIASIESKKNIPTLKTLEKLFLAMGFKITLLPIASKKPDDLIKAQARRAAQTYLDPIFSTMALEEQLPSKRAMEEMVIDETNRLMESETTSIWDDFQRK